jgi:hypothetical protein
MIAGPAAAARAPGRRRPRALGAALPRLGLLALLVVGAPAPGGAQGPPAGAEGAAAASAPPAPRATPAPIRAGAGIRPSLTELGQRVIYRGWVWSERPVRGRWLAPDTSAAFTWGEATVSRAEGWSPFRGRTLDQVKRRRVAAAGRHELAGQALVIELPLQVFALGAVTVPGLRVEIDDGRGPRVYRLPVTTLTVTPVLTAADSNADYRALHGPLAAPWWERVPWTWVALGALLIAAALALALWWRRRRRVAPAAAPAPASALDPRAEALAALAALRALHLPEHGRFAEHAFHLGQLLRRYLEAATGVTRPGDTTPELLAHLRGAGLEAEDLTRLSGLLRVWDRVKFAREPLSLDEAARAERAVEAFVRRPAPVAEKVA